mmetsp:Transcript_18777/g.13608  ORF Transcript_18777/g.13608 Transcript_18777/m.13608 type:complete len:120 (-) Transcript_18777:1018-1377(-)
MPTLLLHLNPSFLEKFFLFSQVFFISAQFFYAQAFFFFFTILSATITTTYGVQLLRVGNFKTVPSLFALHGYLAIERSGDYYNSDLRRYLLALIIVFLAFIAPEVFWDSGMIHTSFASF